MQSAALVVRTWRAGTVPPESTTTIPERVSTAYGGLGPVTARVTITTSLGRSATGTAEIVIS